MIRMGVSGCARVQHFQLRSIIFECCTNDRASSVLSYDQPHTYTTVQRPFVRDYPGRPVPDLKLIRLKTSSTNIFLECPRAYILPSTSITVQHLLYSSDTFTFHVIFSLYPSQSPNSTKRMMMQSLAGIYSNCSIREINNNNNNNHQTDWFQCFDAVGWAAGRASGL